MIFGFNLFVKKGCLKASKAVILYCFLGFNNRFIKSKQFSLTFSNLSKFILYFFMLSKISSSVSPAKGVSPHNKIYIKTPQDHSSLFSSYELFITSGEQYMLVPTIPDKTLCFFFSKYFEQPKSINLIS